MQVSSPRAAERIYIKDGVMKDGRIVARQVALYVDAGAYSRQVALRRGKGGGAHARALHDPERPRRRATASTPTARRPPPCAASASPSATSRSKCRWTSWRALIGMDPLEFRIINAYRDGDMKAHRQPGEGAALIECVQDAARDGQLAVA